MKQWKVKTIVKGNTINGRLGNILKLKRTIQSYGFSITQSALSSTTYIISGTDEQMIEFLLLEDVSNLCEIVEFPS